MSTLRIDHATVVQIDAALPDSSVLVEDGRIAAVFPSSQAGAHPAEEAFDARGAVLSPGFIDLHIHGLRKDSADHGPEGLAGMKRHLPEFGVTSWLATLCPVLPGRDAAELAKLSASVKDQTPADGAEVLGFHIEGPFLTLPGSLPPEALGLADPQRVRALIDAARPFPLTFSIAPDYEDILPLVQIMKLSGAPVFMTHTAADVGQTLAAIAAGASHATHFYDVSPCPKVTEPGVRPSGYVEAVLASPEVSVDFILDGVHVDPIAVKMALQCKGPDRVCLITDAMIGSCGGTGQFLFGGYLVEFKGEGLPARNAADPKRPPSSWNTLAGSGLSMNIAVRNAVRMLGVDLPLAVRMGSANPARAAGFGHRKGRIAPGYDADLTLLDPDFHVLRTWVRGALAYAVD